MSFIVFNLQTELKKLAKGKRTRVSHQMLAIHALEYVEAVDAHRKVSGDLEFLERLFSLADPRAR
jgi:hypothetical protein